MIACAQRSYQRLLKRVRTLYDEVMPENQVILDLIFPHVFDRGGYVGQFSDNSAEELLLLADQSGMGPDTRVLDLGCGAGGPACFWAWQRGSPVVGVDCSRVQHERAEARARALGLEGRVRFILGDALTTPLPDAAFDVVVGTGAWCHMPPRPLFRRVRQLLRVGGRIAFLERVKLRRLAPGMRRLLLDAWACPALHSIGQYRADLTRCGFQGVEIIDLTSSFAVWQRRSVAVRRELEGAITRIAGESYYRTTLALASYEADATAGGHLGYALFVAVWHGPLARLEA
jgi:cyclopropane fatty-acyl-phospholipid synthase-like methyltransferase